MSPEDFVQQDEAGGKVFSHLAKLKKSLKVSYLPYVQNPIKALKHIDASVSEIFINNINDKFNIPKTDILIVNLNDAEESENRLSMLKRHGKYNFQILNFETEHVCYLKINFLSLLINDQSVSITK